MALTTLWKRIRVYYYYYEPTDNNLAFISGTYIVGNRTFRWKGNNYYVRYLGNGDPPLHCV